MKMSLEVLDIICLPQELTSGLGHCHYKKWSQMVDSWFFTLYWKLVLYNSCTSLMRVLCFISMFLDWCLGFEPTLQLKGRKLRALQNETHVRASILNIGHMGLLNYVVHVPRMVIISWLRSPTFFKHMFFLVSILGGTTNHIPLKNIYICLVDNRTPTFERVVIRYGCKNAHQ